MAKVQTTDGVTVQTKRGDIDLTYEQAEASAKERNARAEAMGIQTRYEAVDAGQEAQAA